MNTLKKWIPLLMVAGMAIYLAGTGCTREEITTEHMVVVTDDTFAEVVGSDNSGWVLVDFWAPWCGPCRMLMPVLDELAADYDGRVKFVKVNVDENPALTERFNVRSIPHVHLFKDGRAVDGFLGFRNRVQVKSWLDEQLQKGVVAGS